MHVPDEVPLISLITFLHFNLALKMRSPEEEDEQELKVRWGGKINGVSFTNTCRIDNFLMILWVVFGNFPDLANVFTGRQPDHVSSHILQMVRLIDDGRSSAAKLRWGNVIGLKQTVNKTIDFHGSEYERFVHYFGKDLLKSSTTGTCSACTHQFTIKSDEILLTYKQENADSESLLYSMAKSWLSPAPDTCRLCRGERTWTDRVFEEVPPLLIFTVPTVRGVMPSLSLEVAPPIFLIMQNHLKSDGNYHYYPLTGATYASMTHFRGAFLATAYQEKVGHGWYEYDGLSGQTPCGHRPSRTPPGYSLSTVVYSLLPSEPEREVMSYYIWAELNGGVPPELRLH